MRVLLDINIVLDVLLKREPWVSKSKSVWQANDDGLITGYITGTTLRAQQKELYIFLGVIV